MDNIIKKLYRDYGEYSNYRNLPSEIDGLKPVERRVLYAAYQIARNNFVKSARVDGHVIGNFHPHGSCYGTIVQLVNQYFLDGQGNFGCDTGVEPVGAAASRYTEIRLNNLIGKMAFSYINFAKYFENELGENEPFFLPTMIPLCLLGNSYNQGIGFGYRTLIPCYEQKDLIKRLLWTRSHIKDEPIIYPKSNCDILSTDEEVKEILVTGKGTLRLKGKIRKNPSNFQIIIYSWPQNKSFHSILKSIKKELDNGDVGYVDSSSETTKIIFKMLKRKNREEIFNNIVEKLEEALCGSINFNITIFSEDCNIKTVSVDHLLNISYNYFTKCFKESISEQIKKLKLQRDDIQIINAIKPHIKDFLTQGTDFTEIVKILSNITKIEIEKIKSILEKYNIKKLLTSNFDMEDMDKKIENLIDKEKEYVNLSINHYKILSEI